MLFILNLNFFKMYIMCFLVFNISAIHNFSNFIRSKNKNKKQRENESFSSENRSILCYGVKILNQIKHINGKI